MNDNQLMAKEWFFSLRNDLVYDLEKIDGNKFGFKDWEHSGSGGGTMGSIRGKIVEKGGVNISTVSGQFSEEVRQRIPGAKKDPQYFLKDLLFLESLLNLHQKDLDYLSDYLY